MGAFAFIKYWTSVDMWSRFLCFLVGHPGIVRQWEWISTNPQWIERQDAWMCIRCGKEFITDIPNVAKYRSARPHMDQHLVAFVNRAIDASDNPIRVRAVHDSLDLQLQSTDSE